MSALRAALEARGFHTAHDKLAAVLRVLVKAPPAPGPEIEWSSPRADVRFREVCMLSVTGNERDWDGARQALEKFVWNDPELLRELFRPYQRQAMQAALTEAARLLREQQQGAGQSSVADHNPHARPRRSNAGAEAVAKVARVSMLDTFRVNGQRIGDVTPREANEWAGSRERDARFVRALTANLPADVPIRRYRTPDEANAIYQEVAAND